MTKIRRYLNKPTAIRKGDQEGWLEIFSKKKAVGGGHLFGTKK